MTIRKIDPALPAGKAPELVFMSLRGADLRGVLNRIFE
jgi:hypothetical protein